MNKLKKMRKVLILALCVVLISVVVVNGNDSINVQNDNKTSESSIQTDSEVDQENDGNSKNDEDNEKIDEPSEKVQSEEKKSKTSIQTQSIETQADSFNGEMEISGIAGGNLKELIDSQLKDDYGFEEPGRKYVDITKLILSGSMSDSDFKFIRDNLRTTLKTIDFTELENSDLPDQALSGCIGLTKVVGLDKTSITEIPLGAFQNCSTLESIDLSNITKINGSVHYGAFNNCTSLQNVGNFSNLTYVGQTAFNKCKNMRFEGTLENLDTIGIDGFRECKSINGNIDLGKITTLADRAFYGCTGITKVLNFEKNNIDEIAYGAFQGCTNLELIDLSNVTKINGNVYFGAFNGCTSLKAVGDFSKLTYVGQAAFNNCVNMMFEGTLSSLETIGIDGFRSCKSISGSIDLEKISTLDDRSFYGCTGITDVLNFEKNNIQEISLGAFQNCSKLESIDLSNVTKINGNVHFGAFSSCTSLKDVGDFSKLTYVGQAAFNNCNKMMFEGTLANLETIGIDGFRDCKSITGIIDLGKLNSLDNRAFYNCNGITEVSNFEKNSVKEIPFGAFSSCTTLKDVGDFSKLTYVGQAAFNNCNKMMFEGTLANLETIGIDGFRDCKSITGSIDLGKLSSLANRGFYNCTGITEVSNFEKNSVKEIPFGAFQNCSKLESIDLSNITKINGDVHFGAFSSCTSLKDVGDFSKLTYVGQTAFNNCNKMMFEGTLANLETIGIDGFRDCKSITGSIDLGKLNKLEDRAFYGCAGIAKVLNFEKNDVKEVACGAFQNCSKLESIDLSNVTKVNGTVHFGGFSGCTGLSSIGSLENVQHVGANGFLNCSQLEKVTFSENANYESNSFYGCALDLSKGYPDGTYPNDDPLSSFSNQFPRAYFSLETTEASIGINGRYDDPARITTLYGTEFKDIITPRAPWIASQVKQPKVTVTPDPVKCAENHGIYDISYSIKPDWYVNNGQKEMFKLYVDGTAPNIAPNSSERTSETEGWVEFESDDIGKYYYLIQETRDSEPNADQLKKAKQVKLTKGKNKIQSNKLTNSLAKSVYIMAIDDNGNQSQIVKIDIPVWKWTLNVDMAPSKAGSISINNGQYSADLQTSKVASGESIGLKADPAPGYVFESWIDEDEKLIDNSAMLNLTMIDKNMNVTAKFKKLMIQGAVVYKDIDGDGKFDSNIDKTYKSKEIKVDLYKQEDNQWKKVDTTNVNDNGTYKFDGASPGKYKVRPLTTEGYKTLSSNEFTVEKGKDLEIKENLGVKAEVDVNVTFSNQKNQKVGSRTELYGENTKKLNDLTEQISVKAVKINGDINNKEITIPQANYYELNGKNTLSTNFNFDDPKTFNQDLTFKLKGVQFNVIYMDKDTKKEYANDKVVYPDNKVQSLPDQPSKKGYTFNGWNLSENGQGEVFNKSTIVDRNMTVYSIWNGASGSDNENIDNEPGNNDLGNNSSVSGNQQQNGATDNSNPPDSGNISETESSITDNSSPTVNIGGNEVPLYGNEGSWALMNLILSILGLLLSGIIISISLYRYFNKEQQTTRRIKPQWLGTNIILALLGFIIFIMTQDMSLKMVLTDNWTLVNLVILLAEIMTTVFILKLETKEDMPSYQ